jgi:hypothetical protein
VRNLTQLAGAKRLQGSDFFVTSMGQGKNIVTYGMGQVVDNTARNRFELDMRRHPEFDDLRVDD